MSLFNFKERRNDKELIRQMEEEEKELEKDLPQEKFSIKELFDLLKNKSEEDIEYESLLTESELEEERRQKKEDKKLAIIIGSAFVVMITGIVIFITVFYNATKSDLLKITQPILEDYYKSTYGESVNITSIEELINKNENNEDENTGIVVATTNNNNHIMCINNEFIGDDIITLSMNEEYLNYMNQYIDATNLIYQSVELSYQDYYLTYNRFLDYINTLPESYTLTDLLNSNKLTVTYKLVYQNNINLSYYQNMINTLSDDSAFYLLKQEVGLPVNLTIITKNKTLSLDVTATLRKEEDITYYELSREVNSVSQLSITSILDSSVTEIGDYDITNAYIINYETDRAYNEDTSSYYILKFNSGQISQNSIKQLNTYKNDNSYDELEIDEYKDIIFIDVGGSVYLIAYDEIAFGIKSNKKSFLCNLGIC